MLAVDIMGVIVEGAIGLAIGIIIIALALLVAREILS